MIFYDIFWLEFYEILLFLRKKLGNFMMLQSFAFLPISYLTAKVIEAKQSML